MSLFQKLYNFFKALKVPDWLKPYVQELNDLMIAILKQAGQAYANYLKEKILEAAQHASWTNREKFDYVFKEAKKGFVSFGVALKDNELNTIINYFVTSLKKQGAL